MSKVFMLRDKQRLHIVLVVLGLIVIPGLVEVSLDFIDRDRL